LQSLMALRSHLLSEGVPQQRVSLAPAPRNSRFKVIA
jgi:hypothetical protein